MGEMEEMEAIRFLDNDGTFSIEQPERTCAVSDWNTERGSLHKKCAPSCVWEPRK